ncbi:MAG TPA: hypothetical protein VGE40_01655 [Bacilli bacterium]
MEKNILAFFKSETEAESAAAKLKDLQVLDISIDHFSKNPGEGIERQMNPATGNISSLGKLTLGANVDSRSEGILLAADVDASGMSDGGQGGQNGARDILLTVVMEENKFDQAKQIVEEAGGLI